MPCAQIARMIGSSEGKCLSPQSAAASPGTDAAANKKTRKRDEVIRFSS